MAFTPGTRIGAYQIVSLLGAGGMGEVYRARDSKLNRDVALKVLLPDVADNPERLARFRREAQILAALNHPNIGHIYGLDESEGVVALVLELVDGSTLAERITEGPIPVEEALPIAKQIADALETAHEQGIIHRDLKPANIKLRGDGTVKVLDFGLAKLTETPTPGAPPTGERSESPTITSPAMMTGIGVILGTAAYMAPEQAKGREADKRSDIWAFAVVLYEMLAGARAFDGEDVTDVLGAVLRLEPNWDAIPSNVPQPVRTLLQSCLVKERRHRVSDISTVRFVLDKASSLVPTTSLEPGLSQSQLDAVLGDARLVMARSTRLRVALSSAAALLAGVIGATTLTWFATRTAPARLVRTTIVTSGDRALALQGADRDLVVTPDGSRVIYRGNNKLLVRALDTLEPTVLVSGGAPQGPFVSPDGQWIGFFDGTALKKVAITGGSPVTIAAAVGLEGRGATWGTDGTIVFGTATDATALQRVSAAGGEATVLTTADAKRGEVDHLWPEFLPGGQAVLFTIRTRLGNDDAQIAVVDLRTGTSKVLIQGSDAHYVATGHLVYGFAGTLRAVAFDLGRLEIAGTPTPVLEGVLTTRQGAADIAVTPNGSLIYVPGVAGGASQRSVALVDRQGQASRLPNVPLDEYRDVRISPDGNSIALATQADVWVYRIARATLSRLTTDPAQELSPLWTPDNQRVVFTSTRAGYPELFWRSADGSGADQRLFGAGRDLRDLRANGWSADGRELLLTEVPPSIQNAIAQLAIPPASEAKMLIKDGFNNDFPTVSPGGEWIAYQSNRSGRAEIYVERYPQLGDRQPISIRGGRLPLWSRDGDELFFSSPDARQMFAVPVKAGTAFKPGPIQALFEYPMLLQSAGNRPYDVGRDGRFLIIDSGQAGSGAAPAQNLVIVQNWFDEVKRLVPTK